MAAPRTPRSPRWVWWLAVLPAAVALSFAASAAWFLATPSPDGRLAPDVVVGTLPVGGLPVAEARRRLEARLDELEVEGWTFQSGGRTVTVSPTGDPTDDPDVVYRLASVDVPATIQRAAAVGRAWRLPWWRRVPMAVPAVVTLREDKVAEAVLANFPELNRPAVPPGFAADPETGALAVTPEAAGEVLDRVSLFADLARSLARLEPPVITLSADVEVPSVTAAEAAALLPDAERVAGRLPIVLVNGEWRRELAAAAVLPALTVVRSGGAFALVLRDSFSSDVLEAVAAEIDRPAAAPRFKLEAGRVTLWQPPLDGRRLDVPATAERIAQTLFHDGPATVPLAVVVDPAPPLDGEGQELGLREVIGVGRSNFAGSPKNRRHNIAVGAAALNGLLVRSGEEFSLLAALGPIDAAAGYLEELVIKGDRTIPEFGGGLCQIGTTTFRAALAAGLPILERQNHSYRVRYYEPAGTDATIYGPKPDFRFANDTGHAILIQTRIEGDDLIFEFWGTKDGRTVTQTAPRIYNVTKPPPRKVVPTTALEPGQERCTERAHDGADAEFTYTVTDAAGQAKSQVFRSHYRAWQEVCLVGVAELPAAPPPAGDPAATDGPGADSPAVVAP